MSGSRAGLAARPAPSEPYVQVSPHTAQASASAYEVGRGDRPGRHQRWTRTRVVTRWRVAAHHDAGVAALLKVRIEDRLAGRAPAQLCTFGESGSPQTHLIICYSKSLRYHKENVRRQFLSLRQDASRRTVSPSGDRPLKSPGIRPFFADGCAPWARAGQARNLSLSPAFSVAVHRAHSVPVRIVF